MNKYKSFPELFSAIALAIKGNSKVNTSINPCDFPSLCSAIGEEGTDYRITSLIDKSIRYISEIDLEGITSIGDSAFCRCTNLALTSLPEGITRIGSDAFYRCTNLALTSLPEGITSIGSDAFYNCTNLALTSLPEGITSIGDYAFYRCTNLKSLTFKGTPTTIDSSAFYGCTNLTTINVPWAEGEVANAPWGATNATINYNYTGG